jgi:hypothetical protein
LAAIRWETKSLHMSRDSDTLLAIAEIAGVFVGFAALVTFIAHRSDGDDRDVEIFNLINVVLASVVVIVGALVPVAFHRYGFSEATVWRASSGLLFAMNWGQILYVSRVTQGYRSAHSRRRGLSIAVWALEPVYQLPLVLCIAGVWSGLGPAFYLTALVVALAQVSLVFATLVTMLATTSRS